MTPGTAKTRQELYWLPYPEHDRLIINAHNFPSATARLVPDVAWWCPSRDDTGNGTGTLNDLSGNGRHGTLENSPIWQADTDFGGVRCLEFNGVDQSVQCTSLPAMTTWTVATWAKWGSASGNDGILFGCWGATGSILLLRIDEAIKRFEAFVGGTNILNTSWDFTATGWFHVALTGTSTTVDLYANGTKISTYSGAKTIASSAEVLYLGTRSLKNPADFWATKLDDSRIYSSALSAADIAELSSMRGYV